MTGLVQLDIEGGVAQITLADPKNRNALGLALAQDFARVTRIAARAPEVKLIVLVAQGQVFSVGGDLNEFVAQSERAHAHIMALTDLVHGGLIDLLEASAPVVVGLNGVAAGGGLGLVLAGDLVIASRSARLSSAYTRTGLTPDAGSTWRLPRLLGHQRAFAMMALNEMVSADAAQALGLVTTVVEDAEFGASLDSLVARLVAMPDGVLSAVKALMRDGASRSFPAQLAAEARAIADRAARPDTADKLRGFLKKA